MEEETKQKMTSLGFGIDKDIVSLGNGQIVEKDCFYNLDESNDWKTIIFFEDLEKILEALK